MAELLEKLLKEMAEERKAQQQLMAEEREAQRQRDEAHQQQVNVFLQQLAIQSGQAPSTSTADVNLALQPQIRMTSDFQDVSLQIKDFVYAPEDGLTFEAWMDRVQEVFASDKGANVSEVDKAAIIRAKLNDDDYKLFANNILPKKPEGMTLSEMTDHLKKIFGRKESLFSRRYKAWQIEKAIGEDFTTFASRVNKAAEDFEFSTFKIDDFKAQLFVQGLKTIGDAPVLKELLKKTDAYQARRDAAENPETVAPLTLNELATVAERIVILEKERKHLEQRPSYKQEVYAVVKEQKPLKCHFCDGYHRHAECPYKEKICEACKSKGHQNGHCEHAKQYLARRQRNFKTPMVSETKSAKSARKFVKPKINGVWVSMKHDTGSDWTLISVGNWKRIGEPKLQSASATAMSASGGTVETKGLFSAVIELNGTVGIADVYVSTQGLNLFGNVTMEALNLWDTPISAIVSSISESHSQLSKKVIEKFPSIFSKTLGKCTIKKSSLTFANGAKPPFIRARTVPFAVRQEVEQELKRLHHDGIITPVNYAEAAAPIVPVKKKDGSIRITADYSTGLNRALEPYHYPLPTPESIFAALTGMDIFSTLDLSKAFLQVELDEQAKRFMNINTHVGLFQVNRMQPGVKTAPGQFQQLMDTVLAGTGALAYLDDIIVPGKGSKDHDECLFKVLKLIQDAGFTLQLEKCTFGQQTIRFLGKIIDKKGQRPDPEKLQTIRDMPQPTDITQLRAFLGAVNWYGNFLPNLKDLRGPLDQMLQKKEKFDWTPERELAFSNLKRALHSNLALAHYDPSMKLVVAADASSYGVGAALLHRMNDGSLRPIMYAASSLNVAEKNYPQVEREALALVFAVKKFRPYIYGRHFELQTDHKPLLRIFSEKTGIPVHTANRLRRYALTLLGYDFTVSYVENANFAYADFVSRVISSHPKPGVEDIIIAEIRNEDINDTTESCAVVLAISSTPILPEELRQATAECPHLTRVIEYVESSWPAKKKQISDSEAAEYFTHRGELKTANGCLYHNHLPIIPSILRKQILEELHQGHPGASRMQALAREQCFWPNINHQITLFVQRCDTCQRNAKSPRKEDLHAWPEPQGPWQRIHIDFAEKDGDNFLVIVDAYSNWLEIIKMRVTTAEKTTEALRDVFSRWGPCRTIVSDNGPQFTSHTFKSFLHSLGINHITSAPYHPQSNGRAERFVGALKTGLDKLQHEGSTDKKLRIFLSSHRGTPSSALDGKSPFELMTGRKMPMRLHLLRKPDYQNQNQSEQTTKMTHWFNQHHGTRHREFAANDPVYYKRHQGNGWLWVEATVLGRRGNANYDVLVDDRTIKAHVNQLQQRNSDDLDALDETHPSLPISSPQIRVQNEDKSQDESEESADETFQSFEEVSEEEQEQIHQPTTNVSRPHRSTAGVPPSYLKDYICSIVDSRVNDIVADHQPPSGERV